MLLSEIDVDSDEGCTLLPAVALDPSYILRTAFETNQLVLPSTQPKIWFPLANKFHPPLENTDRCLLWTLMMGGCRIGGVDAFLCSRFC